MSRPPMPRLSMPRLSMPRLARLAALLLLAVLGLGGTLAHASSLSFELRGVVPVVCDVAVSAVRVSGNRATLDIGRQCNTDHLLLVTFDAARLARPGAARFLLDGRGMPGIGAAGAGLRLPAHFSGTRRLDIEAAAGDLAALLRSLRIAVQPV